MVAAIANNGGVEVLHLDPAFGLCDFVLGRLLGLFLLFLGLHGAGQARQQPQLGEQSVRRGSALSAPVEQYGGAPGQVRLCAGGEQPADYIATASGVERGRRKRSIAEAVLGIDERPMGD